MKKKFESWWIIGLILPFIGIPVYCLNKRMSKDTKSNLLTGTIIGVGLWLFFGLSFMISVSNPAQKQEIEYLVSDWQVDIQKEEPVVTVLGLTTCGHCQLYKPTIEKLQSKYNFKLYFFELDTLTEEEREIVETTYDLATYGSSVPFTYIVKGKNIVAEETGFEDRETTLNFLKDHKIIK